MKLSKIKIFLYLNLFCFLYALIRASPEFSVFLKKFGNVSLRVHFAVLFLIVIELIFLKFKHKIFSKKYLLQRSIFTLLLSLLISTKILILIYNQLGYIYNPSYIANDATDTGYYIKDFISLLLCFIGYYYFNRILSIKNLEVNSLKMKISELTLQMNPHFLFNSLNNLLFEVSTSPKKAEKIIIGLSKYYRLLLEATKNSTHFLKDELDLVEKYLNLEKIRTSDKFEYKIELDKQETNKISIPVLLLQPIVENSVKYGIMEREAHGFIGIRCFVKNNYLIIIIRDSGREGQNKTSGSKTALENCQERLRLIYGSQSSFSLVLSETQDTEAIFKIPFKEV